ncbi:MAG TPA: ornithine--oxo-acid transaminase [Myxococcota bacterium]|nr:ornithine--oxo-acid transaminase [Myxococcota bacterium]
MPHVDTSIQQVERYSAHNYHPLPIVVAAAEGVWVHDVEGNRYMDMLAAYSAVNFGHRHPDLTEAAVAQLHRVTLTSRAFHNDQLGPFCQALAELCAMDMVLPMNTGAEAVETAIKTARKWGYLKKKVAPDRAKIIVCAQNFHGRTTTIVSFSTDPQARADFGPFTPGFHVIPYGDAEALTRAIDADTVGFLVEPIQGEAGVIIPPAGYLREVRRTCSEKNVLLLADEIQAGLGRTGKTFACEHEGVQPDMYILGKALGGGIMPLSAVVARRDVLDVFQPGDHGSTFGGNPLACAIGRKVLALLATGRLQAHAAELGAYVLGRLRAAKLRKLRQIRGRGLWLGLELEPSAGRARPYCERLMREGLLCKDTHEQTIRLAPPLIITRDELDWALERLIRVLS